MEGGEQKEQSKKVGGLNKENLDKMSQKGGGQAKKSTQPAWAKSQEKVEQEEGEECDELLDFVDNLDYDKYIDDMEVQNMLNSLKDRIEGLKEEIGEEEEEEEEK